MAEWTSDPEVYARRVWAEEAAAAHRLRAPERRRRYLEALEASKHARAPITPLLQMQIRAVTDRMTEPPAAQVLWVQPGTALEKAAGANNGAFLPGRRAIVTPAITGPVQAAIALHEWRHSRQRLSDYTAELQWEIDAWRFAMTTAVVWDDACLSDMTVSLASYVERATSNPETGLAQAIEIDLIDQLTSLAGFQQHRRQPSAAAITAFEEAMFVDQYGDVSCFNAPHCSEQRAIAVKSVENRFLCRDCALVAQLRASQAARRQKLEDDRRRHDLEIETFRVRRRGVDNSWTPSRAFRAREIRAAGR